MFDDSFLEWLRETTEARWADPGLRDAATAGLGDPTWQPGTRWRGGISESDLEIIEAMFGVRLPAAYRRFLLVLHTPDPPLAGLAVRGGRLVQVEERLFHDWTGLTTPLIAAFERPVEGLLRGVSMGRWHPAWGERPDDHRQRARQVRQLAASAPRLIPFAGQRYLVAVPGADDGPVLAVHGADVSVVAPDLRSALLRELGLSEDAAEGEGEADAVAQAAAPDGGRPEDAPTARTALTPDVFARTPIRVLPPQVPPQLDRLDVGAPGLHIPFWSDIAEGLPWRPPGVTARA